MDEVLSAARSVDVSRFGERTLGDACFGRLVGKVGHGYTNDARGRAVRDLLHVDVGPCWVCDDLTARYDALADLVVRKLDPWEFDSFCIGSKIDPEAAAREESLWAELALAGPEPLKAEVNREIGKRGSDRLRQPADPAPPRRGPFVVRAVPPTGASVEPCRQSGRSP